jgi:hypothetical protein
VLGRQGNLLRRSHQPKNGDYRFLALFGYNGELDLAGLNIEDGVGRIALRENPLVLSVICQSPSFADLGQKSFGIESRPSFSFHRLISL